MRYRILLLGGYGQFGSRVASALASDAGLDLVTLEEFLAGLAGFAVTTSVQRLD